MEGPLFFSLFGTGPHPPRFHWSPGGGLVWVLGPCSLSAAVGVSGDSLV